MGFQLSPGVLVKETDLSNFVAAVATTPAALAGFFQWGPVNDVVLVDREQNLVALFGEPTDDNFEHWFSAANFLGYGNNLNLVRVVGTGTYNASALGAMLRIENEVDFEATSQASLDTGGLFIAKYPGVIGNAIGVSIVDGNSDKIAVTSSVVYVNGVDYQVGESVTGATSGATGTVVSWTPSPVGALGSVVVIQVTSGTFVDLELIPGGTSATDHPGTGVTKSDFDLWGFRNLFGTAPGTSPSVSAQGGSNDELHVVVYDQTGAITGEVGTVLETFDFLSKAVDATAAQGGSNYWRTTLREVSRWVWPGKVQPVGVSNWGTASTGTAYDLLTDSLDVTMSGGTLVAPTDSDIQLGYDNFVDTDTIDIALFITGPATLATALHVLAIAEARQDAVAFISPPRTAVVDNPGNEADDVQTFRRTLPSSSYGFLDSGWKIQQDRFNNVRRAVPLNADMAGLAVRTDRLADPWVPFAGFNRGQIREVIQLTFSPNKSERDVLYPKGINPVIRTQGQGTILFGDRTLLAKPSAFDRVNVRRLFIVLEKAISQAAQFLLFELNTPDLAQRFSNLVEPFLRDVQGRDGIREFLVDAGPNVNTDEVIERNEFKANIFIKPVKSVNFIELNFIATRQGVSFTELSG